MKVGIPQIASFLGGLVCAWMVSGLPAPWAWEIRYDDMRVLQIAALVVLLLGLILHPTVAIEAWGRMPAWTRIMLSLCMLSGAASIGGAAYPAYAFVEWASFASLFLAGLAIASMPSQPSNRLVVAIPIIVGAFVLGWRLISELVAVMVTGDAVGLQSSWIEFLNPRYFAKVATWALPMLWLGSYLVKHKGKIVQLPFLVAGSVIAAHILMSGSRGALAALVVSLSVCAFAFGSPGRKLAVAHVMYFVCGAGIWAAVDLAYGEASFSGIARLGSSGRDALVSEALEEIVRSPWIGIGPMQFAAIERYGEAAAPHNSVLQLAAEWGIPAALGFVVLALMWLTAYLKRVRQCVLSEPSTRQTFWNVAVFAAILAALGQSLIANVLSDPISQSLIVVFVGAASQILGKPQHLHLERTTTLNLKSLAIRSIAMITLAGVLVGLQQGYECVGKPSAMTFTPGFDGRIWPRYWSQGFIPLDRTCVALP